MSNTARLPGRYEDALREEGYSEVDHLLNASSEDIENLAAAVEMKMPERTALSRQILFEQ